MNRNVINNGCGDHTELGSKGGTGCSEANRANRSLFPGNGLILGRNSGIDILLCVILGSVLSRGVNGSAPLSSTLAAAAMVGTHRVFAAITFRHKLIGKLLKGEPRELVKDGRMLPEMMRGSHTSDDDLFEALRIQGKLEDVNRVEKAQLKRNGDISILEKKPAIVPPRARLHWVSHASGCRAGAPPAA